jgi:uncharacterized protein
MKFLTFLSALVLTHLLYSQQNYPDSITELRKKKNETILVSGNVLNHEEKEKIISLSYFQPDSSWIKQVTFKKDKGKPFEMHTSTNRLPTYRRVGYLTFEHEGKTHRLTLYKNLELTDPEYKDYYFLPFKDLTAPNETYGAGRYIDFYISSPKKKKFVIDFNNAYNPYCAYSYRFNVQ